MFLSASDAGIGSSLPASEISGYAPREEENTFFN